MWPFAHKSASAPETKSELTDPTSDSWAALCDAFNVSTSGVTVTSDNLMRSSAGAAVSILSESTANVPCGLLRDDSDDSERAAKDHAAYPLVRNFSNEWMSSGEVRRRATQDAVIFGDGFALVTRVGGRPSEIIYAPRQTVVVEFAPTGEPSYMIDGERYGPADVIHIVWTPYPNHPLQQRGIGLLHAGRDAIGLAILLERSASNLFKNNSRPGGVLSFKGSLNATAAGRIAQMWRSAHGGDKSGGIAVIDNEGKYEPIAFSSVDSQALEMRQFAISEISRLTRVPPTLLSDMSRATWSNSIQLDLQFVKYGLQPLLRAWCDGYARCLLTPEERNSMHFEFDLSHLLMADPAARAAAFAQYRSAGVMTANDVRRELNLPPLPDGNVLASPHVQAPANDNKPPKENAA